MYVYYIYIYTVYPLISGNIFFWLTAHANDHSLRQLAANSGLCLCTLPSSVVSTDFGAHGCAGHVSATLNKIGW